MTIIAWDGRYLAADCMWNVADIRHRDPACKLLIRGETVYAITGSQALFLPMVEWHAAGAVPADIPSPKDREYSACLVVAKRQSWDRPGLVVGSYETGNPHFDMAVEFTCWGYHREFARGVGVCAENAPEVAWLTAQRAVYCGMPIDFVDMESRELSIERHDSDAVPPLMRGQYRHAWCAGADNLVKSA